MTKTYRVTIDFDASANLYVEADSEEEAEQRALDIAHQDELWCIRHNGWVDNARVVEDMTEEVD